MSNEDSNARLTAQGEYEDEHGRIWPKVWPTRVDKAREAVRKAETKLNDAMAAGRKDVAVLTAQVERARKRLEIETERSLDDNKRRWDQIDEHRAGIGREAYNSKRRKRAHPNSDLSGLTPEEKAHRKADQQDARTFRCRKRKAGWTEPQIEAALITRLAEREAKRIAASVAKAEYEREDAIMRALPNFGIV